MTNYGVAVNLPVTISANSGKTISKSGNVFIPPNTETFGRDLDGNVTSDGRWNYTWDAENRLVGLTGRVAGSVREVCPGSWDAWAIRWKQKPSAGNPGPSRVPERARSARAGCLKRKCVLMKSLFSLCKSILQSQNPLVTRYFSLFLRLAKRPSRKP